METKYMYMNEYVRVHTVGEHYAYMYYPYATFIRLVKITCKKLAIPLLIGSPHYCYC